MESGCEDVSMLKEWQLAPKCKFQHGLPGTAKNEICQIIDSLSPIFLINRIKAVSSTSYSCHGSKTQKKLCKMCNCSLTSWLLQFTGLLICATELNYLLKMLVPVAIVVNIILLMIQNIFLSRRK